MEVKNNLLKSVDTYRTRLENQPNAALQRTRQGASPEASARGDRLSLSPEALLRSEAHAAVQAAPEVRQEKVQSIKDSLASGQYTVDAKNIASKMLQADAILAGALKE